MVHKTGDIAIFFYYKNLKKKKNLSQILAIEGTQYFKFTYF